MSLPSFTPSQRRLLVGSAIALALFATPYTYDFSHHQWQPNQAYAKSCFIAGTRIVMADGSERPIETLLAGEEVLDQHGHRNRILAIERVLLGARRLYGINRLAPFFTAEHPFLTTRGWAAIAPAMTRTENPTLAVLPLFTGMHLLGRPVATSAGALALAPHPVLLLVESLCWLDAAPTTALFNLILDGSHSYIANGLIVHNKGGDDSGSDGGGGGDSGGGNQGSGSSGGSDDSGGSQGSDSSGGGDDSGGSHGSDSSGGGDQHAGGDRHAGGEQHGGGERHAGGDRHGGGRGLGNGLDDNGVDAVDASGNKLRGDGTVDDNGVDAVDADGNKLRGDGTVDDNGVDAVDADGNKLRGDGTVDDNGVDAVDASGNKLRGDGTVDDNGNKLRGDGTVDDNGNKLRGDGTVDDNGVDAVDASGNKLRGNGTVDDRGQTLTDEQEQALIRQGFDSKVQP
ncbi:hint domain-containing protein [Aeromonas taiwanensis]|uniref:hint domain-containing protein n=2 Tax=Aeromonas taiwanensis TaxID=633417 RepID=UPI0005C2021F|nr:hint domain-containing protein [Aeromonas taiwanensis]